MDIKHLDPLKEKWARRGTNPDLEFEKWWNEMKPKSKALQEELERKARGEQ